MRARLQLFFSPGERKALYYKTIIFPFLSIPFCLVLVLVGFFFFFAVYFVRRDCILVIFNKHLHIYGDNCLRKAYTTLHLTRSRRQSWYGGQKRFSLRSRNHLARMALSQRVRRVQERMMTKKTRTRLKQTFSCCSSRLAKKSALGLFQRWQVKPVHIVLVIYSSECNG